MNAFKTLIAIWEAEHGHKATTEDYKQILKDALAQFGIHEHADGTYHWRDFEAAWKHMDDTDA